MAAVRDLIERAANALFDPQYASWKSDELLGYLDEGLQTVAGLVPEEFRVSRDRPLDAGARQEAPEGALSPVVVEWGYDYDSNPVAVVPFDLTSMNQDPSWMQEDAGPVRQWASDPVDPYAFWVYPPQGSSPLTARLSYALRPNTLSEFDQEVPLREAHHGALVDYVLYRAYSKNTQYAGQTGLAGLAYNRFRDHFRAPDQETGDADGT